TTLTGCAFAKDVIVDGTVIWGDDKSFVADLTIKGSGIKRYMSKVRGKHPAQSENSRSQAVSVAARWLCWYRKREQQLRVSPTCAADHPNPDAEFEQLIQAIRRHPIEGIESRITLIAYKRNDTFSAQPQQGNVVTTRE